MIYYSKSDINRENGMGLIIKIAWRNLFRHKGKSIIIGMILFFAALLMTFGNAVINGTRQRLYENLAGRFIGDLVLVSSQRENDNILFDNSGESIDPIANYSNIKPFLLKQTTVSRFLPLAVGQGLIMENDTRGWTMLVGVNFDDYQKMFDRNVILAEGRYLTNGERGVLLSQSRRNQFYDNQNYWALPEGFRLADSKLTPTAKSNLSRLDVKSNLVFMCVSKNNMNDLRLPVKGIVTYKDYNHFWGYFCLMDIESFRESYSYLTAGDSETKISAEQKNILKMDDNNLDNLFSGDLMEEQKLSTVKINASELVKKKKQEKAVVDIENGAYNFIAVKLKDIRQLDGEIKRLNRELKDSGLGIRAISWVKASGQVYDGTNLMSSVIFVFILFLYVVVIIVIMNTLNMAAIERSQEIAMMRSIGSKKTFIGQMFFTETTILSLLFGGLGIIAGVILVFVISGAGLKVTDQEMAAIFFASDQFYPALGVKDVIACIIELLAFSSIAVIYPIRLAIQVKPLEAIAKE